MSKHVKKGKSNWSKSLHTEQDALVVMKGHLDELIDNHNDLQTTVDGITDGGSEFDTISEKTAAHGVIVDSVTLKDGGIIAPLVTDATTKDTGSIITEGGIGVEKSIFTGGSVTATTGVITDTISEKTGAAGVTIDSVLLKDGGVSNSAGTMVAWFFPLAAPQALSGPGAITLTEYSTNFTSTGTGNALTLANSTQKGQIKKIYYLAEAAGADTGVITGTLGSGWTSITLNAIGNFVSLVWNGAEWFAVESVGVTFA